MGIYKVINKLQPLLGSNKYNLWKCFSANRIHCSCVAEVRQFSSAPPVPSYNDTFERSLKNPEQFWAEAAEEIVWHKKWDKVLDNSNSPHTKW